MISAWSKMGRSLLPRPRFKVPPKRIRARNQQHWFQFIADDVPNPRKTQLHVTSLTRKAVGAPRCRSYPRVDAHLST